MKAFFNKINITNFPLNLKYNKQSINIFIESNKSNTFDAYELFFIINRYKHEIIINEMTIKLFLQQIKLNENIRIIDINKFKKNVVHNRTYFVYSDIGIHKRCYLYFRNNDNMFLISTIQENQF